MLLVRGENDGQQPRLIPDGIYGRQTQTAVSSFQRNNGLPVTGVANPATWERIVEAYTPALVNIGPAEPLRPIINPGIVIQRGDTGYNIYLIQVILLALAEIYGSLVAPELTGILDDQTSEAVNSFQYLSALPQTGHVDKMTWKHLALHYPLAVNHKASNNITRR